jgi:hypothetical protein
MPVTIFSANRSEQMVDRSFENSEVISESSDVNIPGVVDEMPDPALLPENAALIDKTIFFINRTISGKALETAIVIGDQILVKYFNDDIDAAFSKDSAKPVSFTMLCDHPDLRVSCQRMAVKAAFLNIDSLDPLLGHLSVNTLTMLGKGLMALADEIDKTQIACETLGQKIRQMETEN